MGYLRYKILILVITASLALFAARPALEQIVISPQRDYFTEFWVLGSYHNATYPSDVVAGQNYRLYLDTSNHLGQCAYYVIEIKFCNDSRLAPDSLKRTNSNQPSLGNITFFAADEETVEIPVNFSIDYKINNASIDVQSVVINGEKLSTNGISVPWTESKGGFYGNLFFELWILNSTTNSLQYHQRYLSLWLNLKI
jgi:hypothetical protein